MFKRIFKLFQIARKLSTSGAIDTVNQIHQIPLSINLFFNLISIGSKSNHLINEKKPGEKLCDALQGMGTTFIKLGQFLATRPDIIGEDMAKDLEKLQDKVPAFELYEAKKVIKKEIGEKQYQNIIEIGEPIAAASIAQVHFAKIKNENQEKQVAIKILRPDIEKLFNEELDALMLFAYIVENTITKAKRLKLIEVVHLLREITNIEMDLRFEAAAANELYENTKLDKGFNVPKIYWNYTTKKILTLDKVNGISIREHRLLKDQGVNLKYLAEILYGFIKRDYVKVAEVHFLAGLVPQDASKEEFAQALRSVGEPIFGQSIKDISGGNLLAQLFEITEKFNMATQPPLLLLQKTMVVVEGVARKLYPETNIWEVSKPVLEDWLKNLKGPKSTIDTALNTSAEIIKRIPDFPSLMDRADYALKLVAEGKLNLGANNKNLEIEQMKIKNFRNNIILSFFGIVIVFLLVF